MDTGVASALFVTLKVALVATAVGVVPGFALGLWLARGGARARGLKSVVETLVALPLVLPPTAIGYLVLKLFDRRGPLGEGTLGFDPDVLLTWKGAVIAASVMSLPLIARTARVAFEGVPVRLESMGRSLGLSRARVLLAVTLPLARPGLCAAVLLGFARALGEFGATVVVAGNIPGRTQTLSLKLFEDIQLGHEADALKIVGLSTLLAFAAVWGVERMLGGRRLEPGR